MFKLILVGYAGVGKSNILLKYTKDQFNEDAQSTIGV
jgi:GTPase SAR1 family protein